MYYWNTLTNETRWSSPFRDRWGRTKSEAVIKNNKSRDGPGDRASSQTDMRSSSFRMSNSLNDNSNCYKEACSVEVEICGEHSSLPKNVVNRQGPENYAETNLEAKPTSELSEEKVQTVQISVPAVEIETKDDTDGQCNSIESKPAFPSKTRRSKHFRKARHHRQNQDVRKSRGLQQFSEKLRFLKKETRKTRESITVEQPKPACMVEIGSPFQVEHRIAVKFDDEKVRYDGLPLEWGIEPQRQFGLPLNSCPRVKVEGYDGRVPVILVKLRKALLSFDGLSVDGIFRVSPDATKCAEVKRQINSGAGLEALYREADAHIAANLIKQFYRDLNPNLLNSLSRDTIMGMVDHSSDAEFNEGLSKLEEPQRTAFLWLLDLLAEVAQHHEVNRMTAKNLAIVVAPNLFTTDSANPMEALVLSQKTAVVVTNYLSWVIKKRGKNGAD